jgi:hypothetical protein
LLHPASSPIKPITGQRKLFEPSSGGTQVRPRPAGRFSEAQETEHVSPHCSPLCTGRWGGDAPQRYGQAPNDGVELRLGCRASGPAGPIRKRPEPKASRVPTPSEEGVAAGGHPHNGTPHVAAFTPYEGMSLAKSRIKTHATTCVKRRRLHRATTSLELRCLSPDPERP